MWEDSLTIKHPFGVSVLGSAVIKASPDFASVQAAVSRLDAKPSEAFSKARKAAQAVTNFLKKSGIEEIGTSRITMFETFRFSSGERRSDGYTSRIGFKVILRQLEKTDDIVSGLIESGANEITAIEFQTSKLKEVRAQARQLAVAAAREKARVYAEAAGASIGHVVHIQDVDPRLLQRFVLPSQFHGVTRGEREPMFDSDIEKQTLDPGALEIGAAVMVAFSFEQKS